ncbi:MAG: 1-deoxy-D-xylulose-5-phosphate synthase [Kiritimatiellaeota bacterium]|nr:1-deoxy-D-xylulose-5-phosphate synthase [Kiritimatiellota bacterium]
MAKLTFKRGARDSFFEALFTIAKNDRQVVIVSADCGAPSLDQFRTHLSNQYVSVGIAEQNMVAVAAGMALAGKIPYVYAIAPFATLRCYEMIKVDVCAMHLPITVLGVGAGLSYDIMGPTHHTTEDISIMRALPDMTIYTPSDSTMAAALADLTYKARRPQYVRFDREVFLSIYTETGDFTAGLAHLREGKNTCIVATGIMVHSALRVADMLKKSGIEMGVIDLYRAAPINQDLLAKTVAKYNTIITLEEHFLVGGIGDAVRSTMADAGVTKRLVHLGLPHKYLFEYGGRRNIHELTGLDDESLAKKMAKIAKEKVK